MKRKDKRRKQMKSKKGIGLKEKEKKWRRDNFLKRRIEKEAKEKKKEEMDRIEKR